MFDAAYDEAIAVLDARLSAILSMAQKAGALVSGYTPLHRALAHNGIVCMVLATDIAESRAREYRTWCDKLTIPCWTRFTKARLGGLIGRASRSAVGLTECRFREILGATMASLDKLCSNAGSAGGTSEPS